MNKILKNINTLEGLMLFSGIMVPLVYLVGILSLSLLSGIEFNEVVLYRYNAVQYAWPYLVSFLIKPLVVISAFLLIISFPGVLFVPPFIKDRLNFGLTRFFSLGFAINIVLLFLGTTFLKILGVVIDRKWFMGVIFAGTIVAFVLFFIKRVSFTKYDFSKHKKTFLCFFFLIFIISLFIIFFQRDVLRPLPLNFDYNEGTVLKMDSVAGPRYTQMGVAHHLKTTILPYWLIEYLGDFGVYMWTPPLHCFLDFFNITLLGESYAAFSLLNLLFICGIFMVVHKIICIGSFCNRKQSTLVYSGPALFMGIFLWLYMLPYVRPDISASGWPWNNFLFSTLQGVWIFLMVLIIFFIFNKDFLFALIFSIIASISRYETIPIIYILLLINYFFDKDSIFLQNFLKKYSIFVILFISYILTAVLSHSGGIKYLQGLAFDKFFIRFEWLRLKFSLPTVHNKLLSSFNTHAVLDFIRITMLSTYFFVFLFFIPTRDKITSFCSIFGLIYFGAVVIQTVKLPCYAGLLIPLAGINLRRFIYPNIKYQKFLLITYFIILCMGIHFLF